MTSRTPAQCRACVRFRATHTTCEAYPAGIPLSILVHGADHRAEIPGDNGVRFQQGDSADQRQAFVDWQQTFAGQ